MTTDTLINNALAYCEHNGRQLIRKPVLGYGTDGTVWQTKEGTAVKAFELRKNYVNAVRSYRRLSERKLSEICGLSVPFFEGCDGTHMCIEMSIVQPPYLLDFGKVYIDRPPPYARGPMPGWHAQLREDFGENIQEVYRVISYLKSIGIYYVDPKPANIDFGNQ
jgi:hypothetical protein